VPSAEPVIASCSCRTSLAPAALAEGAPPIPQVVRAGDALGLVNGDERTLAQLASAGRTLLPIARGALKLCTGVPVQITHEGDAPTDSIFCEGGDMHDTVVTAELLVGPSRRVLNPAASTKAGAEVECFSAEPAHAAADLEVSCLTASTQAGAPASMAEG